MQMPYDYPKLIENEGRCLKFDIFAKLSETALFLWGDWPRDMELSSVTLDGHFILHGECPHGSPTQSAFQTVTNPFETTVNGNKHLVGVARCIACREFILGVLSTASRTVRTSGAIYFTTPSASRTMRPPLPFPRPSGLIIRRR